MEVANCPNLMDFSCDTFCHGTTKLVLVNTVDSTST